MELSPNQIKQMIALLQTMLPQDGDNAVEEEERESPIKTKKTTVSKSKNKYKNKFLSMDEKNMHKEDSEIDKKLCVSPPVARNREASLVKVKCRVCGKSEQVSIGMVGDGDRYKCNKCSISAG